MAVSLTNANGDNVSLFGSGNSLFAHGTQTNPASMAPAQTFEDLAADPAQITPTAAGSTQHLGYADISKSPGRGARGRGRQPSIPDAMRTSVTGVRLGLPLRQ